MDGSHIYLGIDFGGNAVKMGLVDEGGLLNRGHSLPTPTLLTKDQCRSFAHEVAEFVHGSGVYSSELGGIGLAVPGVVASSTDIFAPNVSVDWGMLLDRLSSEFNKPSVSVTNDANAAALGELWKGAAADAQSVLFVTIGSGIGSGLIVEGNVISGRHGAAGEIGHITVMSRGRKCNCGRAGCLEQYAAARGLVQSFWEADAREDLDRSMCGPDAPQNATDALSVFSAARAGDPRGLYALDIFIEMLGFALAQVACVVDPDLILLGGGVSAGADLYLDELQAVFRSRCLATCASTEIRCATLSSEAGVYGAARYAMLAKPSDDLFAAYSDHSALYGEGPFALV